MTIPNTYGQTLAPENYAERSWRGGEIALTWMDKAANGEIDYSAYVNLGFARDNGMSWMFQLLIRKVERYMHCHR